MTSKACVSVCHFVPNVARIPDVILTSRQLPENIQPVSGYCLFKLSLNPNWTTVCVTVVHYERSQTEGVSVNHDILEINDNDRRSPDWLLIMNGIWFRTKTQESIHWEV